MRDAVEPLLQRHGQVASRDVLLTALSRAQLDDEIRRGHLVALFPRVYARPWTLDDVSAREVAAVLSVGQPCLLSHVSALRRHGMPVPPTDAVHVCTTRGRHPASESEGLVVHRLAAMPAATYAARLPTARLPDAIVLSWPMLPGSDGRAPAITAVRERLVRAADLGSALDARPRLPGRTELRSLIELLATGCESELELFGYTKVFDVPGLRHAVRQLRVSVRGRSYRLDMGFEDERVAVELDGRAYHSSPEQRERDIRRDLALATIGWLTVRLSHRRLTTDVDGCRRDVLAVLAARRPGRLSR